MLAKLAQLVPQIAGCQIKTERNNLKLSLHTLRVAHVLIILHKISISLHDQQAWHHRLQLPSQLPRGNFSLMWIASPGFCNPVVDEESLTWREEREDYRSNLCTALDGQEGRSERRKWSGSESVMVQQRFSLQPTIQWHGGAQYKLQHPGPPSPLPPSCLIKTNFNFNPNWLIAASMRSKFGRNGNLSDWWYKDRSWLIFQDIKISRYFDMNRRYDLTSPEAELLSSESHQKYQGC